MRVGLLVGLVSICLILAVCPAVLTQSCTQPPNNAAGTDNGKPAGWPRDTQVTVYIDTNQYNTTQVTAIEQGIKN
jgi:hypothetical protein